MTTVEMMAQTPKMTHKARWTLIVLIAICVLPVAASYFAFYVWQPEGRMNYGTLVSPTLLPDSPVVDLAGKPVSRDALIGKWTYLVVAPAACNDACRNALYLTRQVRTAQAQEMDRVHRIWLVTDSRTPDARLLDQHEGMDVVMANSVWRDRFVAEGLPRVWLVDPKGYVMMRYPDELEPKRMIKDLGRLLKYSQQG